MKGMELCEAYAKECVLPVLDREFPDMRISCGLLDYGSDLIGCDDDVSRDHMWGPRLNLFTESGDGREIIECLKKELPRSFMGYSTGFTAPNEEGISSMGGENDEFYPLITVSTFADFMMDKLGVPSADGLTYANWLSFSEHKLLTLVSGRLFRDDLGCADVISGFAYYPDAVWKYFIMSDWSLISEERAFVKRTASRGDDIGSRIVCARIAHRLMHLLFLYNRRYAPYSKWFGTVFGQLPQADAVSSVVAEALSAFDMHVREHNIALAQSMLMAIHNESGLTAPVDCTLHPYFTRDIEVVSCDEITHLMKQALRETPLADLPPAGSLSAIGNLTVLCEDAKNMPVLADMYDKWMK